MPQRRFCSSALLPSAHRTESSVPSFSRQGKGCASWVAFPRFLACTCFANGQVLFYEHRYTSRNGACAQAKSAQFHVKRNQAFPVSPARDKGVPDGEEVQVPVALRGTCFVMKQVLFLYRYQRDKSLKASPDRAGPLRAQLSLYALITVLSITWPAPRIISLLSSKSFCATPTGPCCTAQTLLGSSLLTPR